MGYRTYISKMSGEKYEAIKDFTLPELNKWYFGEDHKPDPEMDYIGVYDLTEELYCFGKYTDFDSDKYYTNVFTNEETNKHFIGERDFWIVKKEFLKVIIDSYQEKIIEYYNKMCTPFFGDNWDGSDFIQTQKMTHDESFNANYDYDFDKLTQEEKNALSEMFEHIRSMRTEWTHLRPFFLEKGNTITNSWKYEYAIFELVKIYKTFDWENDIMIYYGY